MITSKSQTENEIKKLIEKYKLVVSSGKLNKYTEEETKNAFIKPLFEALGWDFSEKDEVSAEENIISSGRVDYGFYLDGRLKFYLEAKSLRSDLHREDYANQAIKYSWNKGATWAILTDFESIKVFNAQVIDRQLADKLFFEIPYTQYIERLDQLWLLSKEAFQNNLIDKEAEKFGKKLQRVSVSTLLYKDLNECRNTLTHDLSQWNPKVDKDLLDEGVQKILDRLLFLRVAEDRGIEPPTLVPLIRRWESKGGKEHLYQSMVEKFRELDEIYNSNLFSPHPFEKWEEYSGATERVAKILYGKQGYYEYDFKAMPADVLGSVYENYLGYRLSQLQKGVSISKDAKKRKEQGIYYTPSFIVDYIVKNALGPVLDKCKSIEDLKRIKVLDPACGSGSFLIKAMDLIYEKYKEFGNQGGVYTKLSILLDNIYGVDLDPQAVEIARLNLLLNTLESRAKLPFLDKNIKNGNSLISGTDEELKKYFGKSFGDKKPFNWEEEFPEVFKQGGFDVIIGNPPYVGARELNIEDKKFFEEKFVSAKEQYDLYILFIEKSLKILKKQSHLSFIVPNKFLITKYGLGLRKFICENASLINFKDYSRDKVFPDASVYPIVFVLKKEISNKKIDAEYNLLKIFKFNSENKILSKLDSITDTIKFEVWRPLAASGNIVAGEKIIVSNREIERYFLSTNKKGNLATKRDRDIQKDKIIMKKLCFNLEAALDEVGYYTINTTYCVRPEEIADLKYMLGVLNSKLLTYFVRHKYTETALRGGFIELRVFQVEKLPIIETSSKDKKPVIGLVDKIISLKKEFHEMPENSNKWNLIKSEIEKTDKKIDKEVYRLYGLTPEEIEIVDGIAN